MSAAFEAPTFKAYEPDRSLVGKLRRRWVRLYGRRQARGGGPGRPRLSISFDDAPISAATTGAEIMAAHGAKATYFISAGLIDQDGPMAPYAGWSDIQRLHAQGHEIGCHTFGHVDLGQANAQAAEDCVTENRQAFEAHDIPAAVTFAYPYGDVAAGPKAVLAPRFALMRALHNGLVEPGADLNQAPSVGLEGPSGESDAMTWLAKAAERNAWLILNAHDVQASPSPWGCTPETLDRVMRRAEELGFDVITVSEGARQAA